MNPTDTRALGAFRHLSVVLAILCGCAGASPGPERQREQHTLHERIFDLTRLDERRTILVLEYSQHTVVIDSAHSPEPERLLAFAEAAKRRGEPVYITYLTGGVRAKFEDPGELGFLVVGLADEPPGTAPR